MIASLISAIITGAIVGSLGRVILPGKQTLSIPKTIGVGFLAAVVAGLVFGAWTHWIVTLIIAAAVAAGMMWFADKQGWLKVN